MDNVYNIKIINHLVSSFVRFFLRTTQMWWNWLIHWWGEIVRKRLFGLVSIQNGFILLEKLIFFARHEGNGQNSIDLWKQKSKKRAFNSFFVVNYGHWVALLLWLGENFRFLGIFLNKWTKHDRYNIFDPFLEKINP